eukprot:TRINITY_DN99_c1_g3_i1.p1 TRINITY_DN99_c1_g3~~TRINITY_DN99_c1_g3_i1.p1  ORF type:complete len:365 (-),score=111.93 TRINITY_DN99_c1_g3_i1:2-1096(-)
MNPNGASPEKEQPNKNTALAQTTLFGNQQFCPDERDVIRQLLQKKLGKEHLSTRPGSGGSTFTYVESWKAIELANSIFGFNGWACTVSDISPDFIEPQQGGRVTVGITAIVRVTLKDGTYHEDVGYGCSTHPQRATAIENAKKEAVSDARKRALRLFGNALGNCIYDKQHVIKAAKNTLENGSGEILTGIPNNPHLRAIQNRPSYSDHNASNMNEYDDTHGNQSGMASNTSTNSSSSSNNGARVRPSLNPNINNVNNSNNNNNNNNNQNQSNVMGNNNNNNRGNVGNVNAGNGGNNVQVQANPPEEVDFEDFDFDDGGGTADILLDLGSVPPTQTIGTKRPGAPLGRASQGASQSKRRKVELGS